MENKSGQERTKSGMIPVTDKGLGLDICVVPPITYLSLISDGEN